MVEARERTGWRTLLPAAGLVAASAILILALSVRTPAAGHQAALVFSFGMSADEAYRALADVDARLVRPGGTDNILIVQFDRDVSWSELRRIGVLMSLDPILAGGCAIGPEVAVATNWEGRPA